jgi:Gpi18-like mannosyltransferase
MKAIILRCFSHFIFYLLSPVAAHTRPHTHYDFSANLLIFLDFIWQEPEQQKKNKRVNVSNIHHSLLASYLHYFINFMSIAAENVFCFFVQLGRRDGGRKSSDKW